MKKTIFLVIILTIFLLNIIMVSSQETNSINTLEAQISSFEQIVVKEHFLTRQEFKSYMDKKAVQYDKFTEEKIIKSFDEVELLINQKINKFLIKFSIVMFGLLFFIQSLFYFVRKRFDRRLKSILDLRKETSIKTLDVEGDD